MCILGGQKYKKGKMSASYRLCRGIQKLHFRNIFIGMV